MESDLEFDDMSWLTQKVSKVDVPNFNIMGSSESESEFEIDVVKNSGGRYFENQVVSLEEAHCSKSVILYDNVVAEAISSDEEIDKM